jgi:DNA-binding response OmpR family regulator
MRGTVLLLASQDSCAEYTASLRANGLLVHETANPADADVIILDVVVTVFSRDSSPTVIRELRSRVDHATSIIVVSSAAGREDHDAARRAGADSVLSMPAPDEVLYEVQRALILRRSGRRLPQSREQHPNNESAG